MSNFIQIVDKTWYFKKICLEFFPNLKFVDLLTKLTHGKTHIEIFEIGMSNSIEIVD